MFWLSEFRKFCASKISLTRHAANVSIQQKKSNYEKNYWNSPFNAANCIKWTG